MHIFHPVWGIGTTGIKPHFAEQQHSEDLGRAIEAEYNLKPALALPDRFSDAQRKQLMRELGL
jgi:hypothetical protein